MTERSPRSEVGILPADKGYPKVAAGLMIGASAVAGVLDWFWCDWFYPGFLFGLIVGTVTAMLVVTLYRREES